MADEPKPLGWMVRWNRQPRYDEVAYFERERDAANYKRELEENGWTDPEMISLWPRCTNSLHPN